MLRSLIRGGGVICSRRWCRISPACWRTSRGCSRRADSTSRAWRSVRPRTRYLSRITVVVMGDDRHLEQVRKQLEKIVTVVKVHDISREDYVERDLMLIKIKAPPALRPEITALVQIFRGRILDVSPDQLMIEISGQEKKIEAFIEHVRHYGIQELARTGRIALVRGDRPLERRAARRLGPSSRKHEPHEQGIPSFRYEEGIS